MWGPVAEAFYADSGSLGIMPTVDFFAERYRVHGPRREALDWSEQGQQTRFRVLAEAADFEGRSVLDIGCGLGDFLPFLEARFGKVAYTGFDFFAPFIEHARANHPRGQFEVRDVLRDPFPEVDLVVSSGLHNIPTGENEAEMVALFRKAFGAAREAVAVNMLSTRADRRDDGRAYFVPERMLAAAQEISRYAVLRHDYLPHDFTLYLYRERRGAAVTGTPAAGR